MKRSCVFCGKTNLTKEHVLPKWIQKHFGLEAKGLHVVNKSNGSSYQFNERAFNRTAKIVCEDCNSGWMSQLETDTQEILGQMITGQNGPITLTSYQRSVLAHWAAKTLTVLEYAGNETVNHIPKTVPTTLYQTGTLLQEHTIYIGFRSEAYGENGLHAAGFSVQSPTSLKVKPEHAQILDEANHNLDKIFSASLVIGHVYFYMTGTNISNAYAFVYPYQPDYLLQIWPMDSTGDIIWPATRPIEEKGNWDGVNSFLNEHLAIDFYKTS